jgi:hypothetical protein
MRLFVFLLFLQSFTALNTFGQGARKTNSKAGLLTGYQYRLSRDSYTSFKYSRVYSSADGEFITTYKIFHPANGRYVYTVIATHNKIEQTVKVLIKDTSGGIFSRVNDESTDYETPSLSPFGIRGDVALLAGDKVPNQLAVKFVNAKYENVKVLSVAGSRDNNDFVFYILEK